MILRAKRLKRGAIDFEFPESKVLLDEQGKPLEIVLRERTIAEMLIEEFMIAANETVAEHFYLSLIHISPFTGAWNKSEGIGRNKLARLVQGCRRGIPALSPGI